MSFVASLITVDVELHAQDGAQHSAAGLLTGFNALLRPGEFLLLRRRDLILPRDLLSDLPLAYVRILGGKTRRFMQRQHAKISDATTVRFLDNLFGDCPPATALFACSPNVFRRRWDACRLESPCLIFWVGVVLWGVLQITFSQQHQAKSVDHHLSQESTWRRQRETSQRVWVLMLGKVLAETTPNCSLLPPKQMPQEHEALQTRPASRKHDDSCAT